MGDKIKKIYKDWSKDKPYSYDVFVIKENGEEDYLQRFLEMSLSKVVEKLIDPCNNEFELKEDAIFEDWNHLYLESKNLHYRIQLFQ